MDSIFFQFYFYLFILDCAGSSLLCGLFSSGGERRLFSSCGSRASHCSGSSRCRAWALGCTASVAAAPGLQRTGSIFVAHRLSCSAACGIFPDQELNPCLLHWPADSLPLSKQGSPGFNFRCNFKVELMVLKRLNAGRERVESRMTSMFFIQVSRRSKLPFIEMQKTTKGTSLG